jgi:hypothetical protein
MSSWLQAFSQGNMFLLYLYGFSVESQRQNLERPRDGVSLGLRVILMVFNVSVNAILYLSHMNTIATVP